MPMSATPYGTIKEILMAKKRTDGAKLYFQGKTLMEFEKTKKVDLHKEQQFKLSSTISPRFTSVSPVFNFQATKAKLLKSIQ